ncbi:50S ribosomal protein L24 [Spiroplasma endosymbiont of Clivina fossor]|uniref:50S ribosomal protein L24 n=1 Tax=Spiroplasma endosymbiont of Clivina fossor TaxID=3066282 RepID=UPI00313CA926
MIKIKIKKGDQVVVIAGKHRGFKGPVTNILKKKLRVEIEGITIKKNQKPTQNDEGGIKEIPASIHLSNVALLDSKDKTKTTKIGYEIKDGKKYRIARKTKTRI